MEPGKEKVHSFHFREIGGNMGFQGTRYVGGARSQMERDKGGSGVRKTSLELLED